MFYRQLLYEYSLNTGFTVNISCFICSYCMNIAFYLVLKSKQMPAHNHPMIKRLLHRFYCKYLLFYLQLLYEYSLLPGVEVQADAGP